VDFLSALLEWTVWYRVRVSTFIDGDFKFGGWPLPFLAGDFREGADGEVMCSEVQPGGSCYPSVGSSLERRVALWFNLMNLLVLSEGDIVIVIDCLEGGSGKMLLRVSLPDRYSL
jgi:hypothetical protein